MDVNSTKFFINLLTTDNRRSNFKRKPNRFPYFHHKTTTKKLKNTTTEYNNERKKYVTFGFEILCRFRRPWRWLVNPNAWVDDAQHSSRPATDELPITTQVGGSIITTKNTASLLQQQQQQHSLITTLATLFPARSGTVRYATAN